MSVKYPLFQQAAEYTLDDFWKNTLIKCSTGSFPSGYKYINTTMTLKYDKQSWVLPKEATELFKTVIQIFKDNGMKSDRFIYKINEVYPNSSFSSNKKNKTNKRTEQTEKYIQMEVDARGEIPNNELKQLKALLQVMGQFKIDTQYIIYNEDKHLYEITEYNYKTTRLTKLTEQNNTTQLKTYIDNWCKSPIVR